ncbi:nucleolar protein 14 [Astyanax mexicanus]|uniref:nucleolar protein 14 n=1 Tax=Astyanax mexicanus TaxID=7994 RepID=UPI0020CB0AFE|nr:nucleolar protein 14 [Astyanax mexicanus]XP_022532059.2 nucleolar protein 14 [Astyanax mexicanus]
MGKPPKKRSLADKVRKTKTSTQIKNNPFEVKINRKKFDVLGQKSKHDVGLPGVSRSKAINKRKNTLLKEFRLKNKANKFVDRRFGEYDTKMAPEDKILKRFTMERQRSQTKKDLYNLNEEEELTHYGQSLAEMEKMTDMVDSDSDSEEKGLLSAELTAAHFGGGGLLRMKTGEDGDYEEKPRSRQEIIEELILKSKQEKRERQTQKEESQELTEKLDQEWRSVQSLLAHKTPKSERKDEPDKPKMDDYDVMVRELGFEMKARPSEKLKTPEEVAREERERLQKLEADRLRRMLGEESTSKKPSHMSADDLNDGFILDTDDRKTLSYQDGQWNVDGGEEEEGEKNEEDEDDGGEEENEECDGGDDDDDADDDEDAEDEDDHSDLDSEQGSGAEDEEGDEDKEEEAAPAKAALSEEERRAVQQAAKEELPYTFKAPESFSDLKELLLGHSVEQQRLIVERIQKCNHPSLAVGNKAKLEKLFGFLLEYVGELATQSPPELSTINTLIPQVYSLCQLFPASACKVMQTLLSDGGHSMEEAVEVKGRAAFPGLDMLIYLKIAALLFPTSDFRHPVTTPAFLYISQALTKCPVSSLESVSAGLVLCCLAVEFVSLSKRFIPELINFLLGLLHLAVPADTCKDYCVVSPFRQQGKASKLLLLCDTESSSSWSRKPIPLTSVHRVTASTDLQRDHHRLSVLDACLDLVKRCATLYRDLPSYDQIFQPIRTLLTNHLPVQSYPPALQELQREILEAIPETPSQRSPLVFDKKKPIALKMLQPKIVEVLDYGKKRGNTKEEKERERLKHKYKKEFKGALRELRKDTRFLAQAKLSDIMSRDAERKRKVKELYGSLATQEGEWKALKRKKRK